MSLKCVILCNFHFWFCFVMCFNALRVYFVLFTVVFILESKFNLIYVLNFQLHRSPPLISNSRRADLASYTSTGRHPRARPGTVNSSDTLWPGSRWCPAPRPATTPRPPRSTAGPPPSWRWMASGSSRDMVSQCVHSTPWRPDRPRRPLRPLLRKEVEIWYSVHFFYVTCSKTTFSQARWRLSLSGCT